MRTMGSLLRSASLRPFFLLIAVCVVFSILQGGGFFSIHTIFSVFQHFATVGLVALALSLTMLMREFDLSVAGMMVLGGCVAVLCGNDMALVGLAAAVATGILGGFIQSVLILRLGLGSVAVSLGGLLTFGGIAYVITGNQTIAFENMDVAILINAPWFGLISLRAFTVLALFIAAAFLVAYTRIGRDIIAIGSNRPASIVAGVDPDRLLMGVFVASGALTSLAGAMLSYGLLSASPAGGVSDILVPAVAAAILGGVSLSGGVGRPLGVAAGVLILCVLRTGLTSLGVEPYVHDIVTGAILLAVAIVDGPHLRIRLFQVGKLLRPTHAVTHQGE